MSKHELIESLKAQLTECLALISPSERDAEAGLIRLVARIEQALRSGMRVQASR